MSLILGFYSCGPQCGMAAVTVYATIPKCRGPSSIQRRAEHTLTNLFDIVNLLLMTNDGRGGMPN